MAINNINTLQKLAYMNGNGDLQTISDIYLKQSLSNLGQRFSVKGDGVSIGEFTIDDLFTDVPYITDESIAYSYTAVNFKTKEDSSKTITLTEYSHKEKGYREVTISNENYADISALIPTTSGQRVHSVNGTVISYYGYNAGESGQASCNGVITLNGNDYTILTLTHDNTKTPLDITLDEYDDSDSIKIIKTGVHIFNIYNTIYLAQIKKDDTAENSQNEINYTFELYELKNNSNTNISTNSNISSLYNRLYSNIQTKNDWNIDTIISQLLEHSDNVLSCNVIYNTSTKSFDEPTDIEPSKAVDLINIIMANCLEWKESIIYGLPLFKEYVNKELYFDNNDNIKLKKSITAEIFDTLYETYCNESDGDLNENNIAFRAYVPNDYKFIYTCNSNNRAQIFSSSKDITVEAISTPEEQLYKIWKNPAEQLIICTSSDDTDSTEDIFSIWRFYITYDSSDILDDIAVERYFVLPYINDDGYWTINNLDTSIYARGKNSGQPALIISYTDTYTGTNEILTTFNKDELLNSIEWDVSYFAVRPLDANMVQTNNYHLLSTYTPIVSPTYLPENLVTFLENAVIMSVVSVHSEDTEHARESGLTPLSQYRQLGDNAVITTFWALEQDKETKEYNFTYAKQPGQSIWAVDYNYLTDIEAIIKHYMNQGLAPDTYEHRWLVFTGLTSAFKNTGGDYETAWPTITYRDAEWFAEDMFDPQASNPYSNKANIVPHLLTYISKPYSYIDGIGDSNQNKFFKFRKDNNYGYIVSYAQAFIDREGEAGSYKYTLSYDYYPSTNLATDAGSEESKIAFIPTIDYKEMFLRNMNVLNRYNILSTDNVGRMYYSYYGTSFLDNDKTTVHLGTYETNINIGQKTMITAADRKKFNKHKKLDIDFDNIFLNGNTIALKPIWQIYETAYDIEPKRIYSTEVELAYISKGNSLCKFDDMTRFEMACLGTRDAFDNYVAYVPFISIPRKITDGSIIGNSTTVKPKYINISYLNVDWLIKNLNLGTNENNICYIAEPGKLIRFGDWYPTYILELTTDILDSAQVIASDSNAYCYKMNPLSISYTTMNSGTYTYTYIHLRETQTTMSTAYSIYDGGELG